MRPPRNAAYAPSLDPELLDSYLNGPRTLSNSRLSYLILSEPGQDPEPLPTPPRTPSPSLSAGSFDPTQDEVLVTEDAPAGGALVPRVERPRFVDREGAGPRGTVSLGRALLD